MDLKYLNGSMCALVTPFEDLKVDEEGLRQNIEFQIKNKSAGLVPCGSTGESAALNSDEHKQVVEITVDAANSKIPVIAGTGSNSTQEALELTRHAHDCGASAVLMISPYYNKPTQEGLYQHYKTIATNVDIPIILYNIQSRTAVNIEPETIARLAKLDNVIGVKEASGNLNQVSKIIYLTRDEDFIITSGDDSLTLPMMSLGGIGVISVTANILPKQMAELVENCANGNMKEAMQIHYELLPLLEVLFCETNPGPIKFAMNELGMAAGIPRLPLVEITKQSKEKVGKVLEDMGLLG